MRTKPGPAAKLLPSAHAIEREFRVMRALADTAVPVARMHLLCEDEAVIGRAFYVMQFVDGRVLWEQSLPGFTPGERGAIYDEMNRVIAALHSVNPAQVGLADYGKPGNYFVRQITRWTKQYQMSALQVIPEMDRLIDWLPSHLPPSALDESQVSIVHGDYRLDNLIFAADQPRIAAVLDWELSTLGDPLADFTYHLMAWHMPASESAAGTATLVGHDLAALGIPSMMDYIAAYVARTGLDPRPHLAAYLAYNFFRIAAILQGIIGRVRDGTATSEFAPAKAELIRPLAEKAWQFAKAAGP
jgi:aminoglycoside phosphotransferase (APT) family kinase protein